MRSATPKVLHPLCGRPLMLWPVSAAPAGRRRARSSSSTVPSAGSPTTCRTASRSAIQERAERHRRRGQGGRVRTSTEDAPVVVLSGDVPLITAEAIQDAGRGARRRRAPPPRWPRWCSTTRPATGASSAPATATSSGSWRPRRAGDATPEQLAIREVNTGIFCFDGGALLEALDAIDARQRPGRVLPAGRPADPARPRAHDRRARDRRRDAHARRQRPRRPRRASACTPSSASTRPTCAPA